VFWTSADIITLLAVSFEKGESRGTLFRLSLSTDDLPLFFKQTSDQGVVDCILSADEERIALIYNEKVILKNYTTWKQASEIDHLQALHVLWAAEDEIIIAGALFSGLYNLSNGETRVLAISQAESFGFAKDVPANANTDVVQLMIPGGGKAYGAALDQNYWQEIENYSVRERNVASDSYRVYLENLPGENCRNMVMVRDIRRFGTIPLFSGEDLVYEQFPVQEEAADFTNFSHGSRIRQREVALVFNAVDNIEGLTPILDSLAEYNFRCTFFINGEVIRRYPDAVREIAGSGHEVGSLFYTYFNMTDSRFQVDKEFIKSGLGRNEDDYFAATGKELSLFWHAPYYFVNSAIIEASREMNYAYIGRDVDSLDWVSRAAAYTTPDIYLPTAQLIERIMKEKKPGSIIPVQVGMPEGGRDDYLFNNIDILIDNLVKVGYRIVTVSTLVEHAR
jgi:peptidoglycan/xylan/chitin deacetylase (PgdA/CDA1 family)